MAKVDFKKLQAFWYDLLKEAGFEDIEQDAKKKAEAERKATQRYGRMAPELRAAKEAYFRGMLQAFNAHEADLKDHVEQFVLKHYAAGVTITRIIAELNRLGRPRTRLAVRHIIRKYEKEWGVK